MPYFVPSLDKNAWQSGTNILTSCIAEDARAADAARSRYEEADREFRKLEANAREIGLNAVDGAYAMRTATQQFNHALSECRESVIRFSDFILHQLPLLTTGKAAQG